jgi:2-methylcitrate dehydratase
MAKKTYIEELAAFAVKVDYGDLSEEARAQLKLRVLDTIGCAIAALCGGPVQAVREQITEFGGKGPCTPIGMDGATAPDRAAFYNGALVRYVDFMDNYMGKKQSCHPSDNFASVLAASEYAARSGKDFMAALALAYAVLIKLIDTIPVEEKGFDHTVHLAYSMAAGISKALGLDERQTANALAISGTAFQGLVTTRSGYLSNWKGLASAMTALGVMNSTFLAKRGITGPLEVLEGKNGLMEAFGEKAKIEWSTDDLDLVTHTSVKSYNAEVHSQSCIEGMLELREKFGFRGDDVEKVDVTIFKQAFNIIGEGEEAGDKHDVRTKEEADHSLPYIMAVAIIDGEVTPRQYEAERIQRDDVQELLKKVRVQTQLHVGRKAFEALDTYTQKYPEEMPCKIVVRLKDGREIECEKTDYYGFYKRPMSRKAIVKKFERLTEAYAGESLQREIENAVDNLEGIKVADLTQLLAQVRTSKES